VDRDATDGVAGEVLGDVPALGDVPDDGERRPTDAGPVVVGGGVGDGLIDEAGHERSLGRSTDSSPATVKRSGTRPRSTRR
jgi:hypothetical protein